MKREIVSGMMLTLLFIGILTLAFNIQPVEASGIIYIRADGSIDPPTASITTVDNVTYIFTGNINDSIVIERDNIIVDGVEYTVQGSGSGTGIDLSERKNVTIKNTEIKSFDSGIWLSSSSNNTIKGNNISASHGYGIWLEFSANNNLTGNNIADNGFGIWLESSSGNSISVNNITNCNFFGITLSKSSDNTLSGNSMANNGIGIWLWDSFNSSLSGNVMNDNYLCNFGGVSGHELSHFIHSIDVSNLVDGKPVHYLVNRTDLVISSATVPQVGYLALINCVNVTVAGLTLIDNGEGLLIAYTNNSRITCNNVINNNAGVVLYESSGNTLYGNTMKNNYADGLYLELSSNNTVSRNTIRNNYWGIELYGSSNNSIHHNNFVNNTVQIYNEDSFNVWDRGHEGNYWSNYNGTDLDEDGIGDTYLPWEGVDHYPLMSPYFEGDVNKDTAVDIFDAVIVAAAFGSRRGDPRWDERADLRPEFGLIDLFDFMIVAADFGKDT